jgi:hypothetical protein
MTSENGDISATSANSTVSQPGPVREGLLSRLGRLFPRDVPIEKITTSARFDASPEIVWQKLIIYEDVLAPPPLLLRILLTAPVRSEGDKSRVGENIRCTYTGGNMVKTIRVVEPPRLLEFDATEQHLGIEGCVVAVKGSYELRSCGNETEVVATTYYRGYLRPRFFWRPFEQLLTHQLHRHILEGMRASLSRPGLSAASAPAQG